MIPIIITFVLVAVGFVFFKVKIEKADSAEAKCMGGINCPECPNYKKCHGSKKANSKDIP